MEQLLGFPLPSFCDPSMLSNPAFTDIRGHGSHLFSLVTSPLSQGMTLLPLPPLHGVLITLCPNTDEWPCLLLKWRFFPEAGWMHFPSYPHVLEEK